MCKSLRIEQAEFSIPNKLHYHCMNCGYLFSEAVGDTREHVLARDSMNITIQAYTPIAKSKTGLQGVLEVLLIDIGVLLRGVTVNVVNRKWFFSLPWRSTTVIDGHNHVRYPVFSYTDSVKTQALRSLIAEKGREYIEQYYLEH